MKASLMSMILPPRRRWKLIGFLLLILGAVWLAAAISDVPMYPYRNAHLDNEYALGLRDVRQMTPERAERATWSAIRPLIDHEGSLIMGLMTGLSGLLILHRESIAGRPTPSPVQL